MTIKSGKQTTTDDADRRKRAKQYWPIRRASNKLTVVINYNKLDEDSSDVAVSFGCSRRPPVLAAGSQARVYAALS